MDGPSKNVVDLQQENQALRRELAEIQARNQALWGLLVGVSRRLQSSSASIKAAVSSLLNYEIFWDASAQHEFLETIDSSVDQASKLIMLVALAFHFEVGSLEMDQEPQTLQEILSTVQGQDDTWLPKLDLEVSFPTMGKPALVDYEYLGLALKLLLEVFAEYGPWPHKIRLEAIEQPDAWFIQIEGIEPNILELLPHINCCTPDELFSNGEGLTPEILLRLYIACQILCLQDIRVESVKGKEENAELRLVIPAVAERLA